MLNRAERFEVLKWIHFWCKVGLLPIKVNLSTWELRPHAKTRTTWKCHFWFFLFAVHGLYKLISLVYWLKVGIPLHQAVIHATLAALPNVYCYWYYFLYIKHPHLFGTYVGMTLTGNEIGVNSQNVRSWSRRLKQCTLQDLFAVSMSYLWPPCFLAVILIFICNPSMTCLLYAVLPREHQTWITFGILLFEELRFDIVICALAIPILTVQVISFELVRIKLHVLIDHMQRAALLQRSGHIYKSLRSIQLYVGIINLINCNIIFSSKLLCLGASIGTGYAAIAHFGDYPIFGVVYYAFFGNVTLHYIFSYDSAFKIPAMFHQVTRRAMLVTHMENSEASRIFKRRMQSFPRVGIKVGEFHLMERESTLNYIDFIVNNIVSMLVAFGDG